MIGLSCPTRNTSCRCIARLKIAWRLIKADTQFDSVIVDPYGRILSLASSSQGKEALVMADVPIGTGNSPQVFLGDWVGWLCLTRDDRLHTGRADRESVEAPASASSPGRLIGITTC